VEGQGEEKCGIEDRVMRKEGVKKEEE